MSEHLDDGPLLDAPVSNTDQPPLHEDLGPELEGLDYWTHEFGSITSKAFARIDGITEAKAAMPRWAVVLQQRYSSMRNEARISQRHLIADTEAVDHGKPIARKHNMVGSIQDWYRRLGPTNEATDLIHPMLGAVDTLEKAHQTTDRDFLIGNILEDVALRTDDYNDKKTLLLEAKKAFSDVEHRVGASSQESRAAFRHNIDCSHLLIAEQFKHGDIDETTYYEKFEKLQSKSAMAIAAMLDNRNDIHMGDGEALEWASVIYARHRFWTNQNAEQYIVRSALLREDQAIYPWRAEGAQNPIWSFDTVITDNNTGEVKSRMQLKNGGFFPGSERDRVYLPTEVDVVRSEIPAQHLRALLARGSNAIRNTYKAMHATHDDELRSIEIDQDALDAVSELFDSVLA
jgi:hypothetical protein